jgi:hypothetical protein
MVDVQIKAKVDKAILTNVKLATPALSRVPSVTILCIW